MVVATGLALLAVVSTCAFLRLRTAETRLELFAALVFILGFVAFRQADSGGAVVAWIFLPLAAVLLTVVGSKAATGRLR